MVQTGTPNGVAGLGEGGHPLSVGGTPTLSDPAGGAFGSSALRQIIGTATDSAMTLNVLASGSSIGTGVVLTVTFATPWSATPKLVISSTGGADTIGVGINSISTTAFSIVIGTPPVSGQTYQFTILAVR